jgi:hypothetical protein
MAPREFTDEERIFIVEQWARNPNQTVIRRKWQFFTSRPSRVGIQGTIARWKATGSVQLKKTRLSPFPVVNEANMKRVKETIDEDPKNPHGD